MKLAWFGKSVTVEESIRLEPGMMPCGDVISGFLVQQGYREIAASEQEVSAVRGRKVLNLVNAGDPRRHHHSTKVTIGPDAVHVKTHIDSWFSLGTKHDVAVFFAEIEVLRHLLQTKKLSLAPLQEAQARRRKSDLMILLSAVGIAILLGIAVAIAVRAYIF